MTTWQKFKASLLCYNQIILYPSLSVYYYPAPGPSFFTTDIQKVTSVIPYFPPLAMPPNAEARSEEKDNGTLSLLAKISLGTSNTILIIQSNPRMNKDNPPIYDTITSMEPLWRGGGENERKNTRRQKGPSITCRVNENIKTINCKSHYLIMVISARFVVITPAEINTWETYAPLNTSRRTKPTPETLRPTNDSRAIAKTIRNRVDSRNDPERCDPNLSTNYPPVMI